MNYFCIICSESLRLKRYCCAYRQATFEGVSNHMVDIYQKSTHTSSYAAVPSHKPKKALLFSWGKRVSRRWLGVTMSLRGQFLLNVQNLHPRRGWMQEQWITGGIGISSRGQKLSLYKAISCVLCAAVMLLVFVCRHGSRIRRMFPNTVSITVLATLQDGAPHSNIKLTSEL